MPGQNIPFNNQFASPYALPQPQLPSIRGLRNVLGKELGVEPNSRIDNTLGGLEDAVPSLPSGTDIWHSLAHAPAAQPQAPYSREAAVASGSIVPLSQSPYGQQPAGPPASPAPPINDPLKGGSMAFSGGNPQLSRTPGALDNFAALSKQFAVPSSGSLSTEELYKGAYADPETRAPGSNQWNMEQLGERTGANALAEEKMRQPAEIARINAAGGIGQQQVASQGQRDVADIGQRGLANSNKQYYDFQQLMSNQGRDIAGGTAPGRSGGGSVRFAPQANLNPLLQQVTTMRYAAEDAMGRKWSWDGPTSAERALRQSIENVLLQDHTTPPDVKDAVRQVLSGPQYAGMSNEQIAANADNDDGTPMTPVQQQKLMEYLSAFR